MKSGKKISISTAKSIAKDYGYSQVIIHAYDGNTHIQHVTTYGKSQTDCENAAAGGNAIKKLLKWDESLCNAKPSRQKKREKVDEILNGIISVIENPNPDDTINLAKFTAFAVLAQKLKSPTNLNE